MKIAFFSNFLNHHQLPMCLAFHARSNDFKFIACERIPAERLGMGYVDMNEQFPFVVRAYETPEAAEQIALEYDVVIFGASCDQYLAKRMQAGRLSFRFCERLFKKGAWRRFVPTTRKKINKSYIQYKNAPLYILAASAYTAADLALCGFPQEKCFKWGYFPEVQEKNADEIIEKRRGRERVEILYAGRLLRLKRVEDTVCAIAALVKRGVSNLHFTIIGDGEQKQKIEDIIKRNRLEDYVALLPFTSPEKVREHMEQSDIYVFGSDFREGWGAVVNEAMNSVCALVASHAVGSIPFLIKDGENGVVYKCGDVKGLASKLSCIVQNREERERIACAGYSTITGAWTAENAVERFLELCSSIINGSERKKYEDGPCSPAKIIKNNWLK